MTRRLDLRLDDVLQAIDDLRALMAGRAVTDLQQDRFVRAAFERFMEIISEASRYIPQALKDQHAHVPWRDIANFGNILRHVYHTVDAHVLWDTYVNDLDPLRTAVSQLRAGVEGSEHRAVPDGSAD